MQTADSAASNAAPEQPSSQLKKGGMPKDFPFDLNNLFSLQFDNLRAAIEYIARQQSEQQVLIQELLSRPAGVAAKVQDFTLDKIDAVADEAGKEDVVSEVSLGGTKVQAADADKADGKEGRSLLQETAHQTNRMLGNLHEKIEKMQTTLDDHQMRMITVEQKYETSNDFLKKAEVDINELIDRVNKMDNTSRVRKVLENTELSDESIELILGSINEVQDRLQEQFKTRLEQYVTGKDFKDVQNEQNNLKTRMSANETTCKTLAKDNQENAAMIENSRKRIQRLISDFELMKRKTNSALETYSNQPPADGLKIEDLEDLEISGEGTERIKKMIQVVETNLNKRINAIENKLDSFNELETELDKVKETIAKMNSEEN